MVNNSRSFARQVLTLLDDPDKEVNTMKSTLLRRHVACVNCLAAHLRGQPCPLEVQAFIPSGEFARSGTDLQSPFRDSEHQIQMEALCETIEKTCTQCNAIRWVAIISATPAQR